MRQLFIGVDGGGTKTVVRVEDEAGNVLGQAVDGPANIRISVDQAWQSINAALEKIFKSLGISLQSSGYELQAGMGLAGCELKSAYHQFLQVKHPFNRLTVASDAYTACIGAHGGQDGAIIIIGTGVVGFQIEQPHTSRAGGFGFPHDDQGGGAWLGLQAVSHALACHDGRAKKDALSKAVENYFDEDVSQLVSWANQANSTQFAILAPLVIEQAQRNEASAVHFMQRAAKHIDDIHAALQAAQHDQGDILPRVLCGGMAEWLRPYLSAGLQGCLRNAKAAPDKGAILLARNEMLLERA